MKEKGSSFSQTVMVTRLGIGRETFRLMLKGRREIYHFELEKIAKILKISEERIMQEDTKHAKTALDQLLKEMADPLPALQFAQNMYNLSIGITEKGNALNDLSRAHYTVRQYEQAHQYWKLAYEYAQKVKQAYDEHELVLKVASNMMLSYVIRKEYSNLYDMIGEVDGIFQQHPDRAAVYYYSVAKIAENNGDVTEAKRCYYQSYECFEMTENRINIAKSKHNLAAFEYRMGNLVESKHLFEMALEDFQEDAYGSKLRVS
jgi:tetratricopeptide (TPR) repeat protein